MLNGSDHDEEEYNLFVSVHEPALKAANIPPLYWRSLHLKLANEVCGCSICFALSFKRSIWQLKMMFAKHDNHAYCLSGCVLASVPYTFYAFHYSYQNHVVRLALRHIVVCVYSLKVFLIRHFSIDLYYCPYLRE